MFPGCSAYVLITCTTSALLFGALGHVSFDNELSVFDSDRQQIASYGNVNTSGSHYVRRPHVKECQNKPFHYIGNKRAGGCKGKLQRRYINGKMSRTGKTKNSNFDGGISTDIYSRFVNLSDILTSRKRHIRSADAKSQGPPSYGDVMSQALCHAQCLDKVNKIF